VKIDFARPDREHEALRDELEEAASRVLRSGRFILGDEVARFERAFAAAVGAAHAVGVSSGTDALATALHALGVHEGDEVIVGAFGFVAAPEAVLRTGARPVFVDVEPLALALDAAGVRAALTPRTRAIVSVDLFGVVHDLAPLRDIAQGLPIIEDAAQALGATFGDGGAGTHGDIGVYSFFPSKALGAGGDGGACVTNDERLASRMVEVRAHGSGKTHPWQIRGGNYRLDALQAAILSVKLDTFPSRVARRQTIGRRLVDAAQRAGASPIVGSPSCTPCFAPLALRVPEPLRNDWLVRLRERGIDARVHYPTTLPACPPFATYADASSFPKAARATRELLSVPCHPEMTDDEVSFLEDALVSLRG
jgi:dTDP-4-amino-4,6-dideoxygalactose transaminase